MPVHYERNGQVATFTFDNGKVNVLTPQMHKELHDHLRRFVADEEVRVGIMTGAGDRAFCAGDDIKTPENKGRTRAQELEAHLFPHRNDDAPPGRPGWETDVMLMPRYKPIIAAVNGYCLGQGLIYLLLLTDIRIASENAVFGFPEIAYGMGGAGGATRLGRQMPHTAAMWMLLTGETIDAEEALRANLVNRVVPREKLMETAEEVAAKIARHPPVSIRVEMEAYYRGMDMARNDALVYVGHLYRLQRMGYEGFGAEDGFFGDEK